MRSALLIFFRVVRVGNLLHCRYGGVLRMSLAFLYMQPYPAPTSAHWLCQMHCCACLVKDARCHAMFDAAEENAATMCIVRRDILLWTKRFFPRGRQVWRWTPWRGPPLWSMGLNYRHGTGHGVGAALNVHEGPQSISHR